jgi:hypothetical protein
MGIIINRIMEYASGCTRDRRQLVCVMSMRCAMAEEDGDDSRPGCGDATACKHGMPNAIDATESFNECAVANLAEVA